MTSLRLTYASFRRCLRCGSFFIFLLWLPFDLGAQPVAPGPSVPPPAFTLPADVAPLPFPLPSSRLSQQKRVSALLRGFEPVQAAEVLLTGDGAELSAQVLLKRRPGRRLTAATLQNLVTMTTEACPGLTAARLTVVDGAGQLLYTQGQVQPTGLVTPRSPGGWWLLAGLLVAAVVYVSVARPWCRGRVAAKDAFTGLETCDAALLQRLLARERPELQGVLARETVGRSRRRLCALLHGRDLPLPQWELEPEVRETLAAALRREV